MTLDPSKTMFPKHPGVGIHLIVPDAMRDEGIVTEVKDAGVGIVRQAQEPDGIERAMLVFQLVRSNRLKKLLLSACNDGPLPVFAKDTSCVVTLPATEMIPACCGFTQIFFRSSPPLATRNNAPSDG